MIEYIPSYSLLCFDVVNIKKNYDFLRFSHSMFALLVCLIFVFMQYSKHMKKKKTREKYPTEIFVHCMLETVTDH